MVRLSDQLVDRIKQHVSLVALVQAKRFTLKAHGHYYVMGCITGLDIRILGAPSEAGDK